MTSNNASPDNQIRSISAVMSSSSNAANTQSIDIRTLPQPERKKLGLKTLGIFWGLAFCSIFLPLAHFVLVPAFFLLGPIFAWKSYKVLEHIQATKIVCPECKQMVEIKEQAKNSPVLLTCPSCKYILKLTLS